ncbi:Oligomerization domain-containing protein [Scenedesmus sp. NREL 46B-D3]|nr:Oligomerization domain-containing protein [Scenedesmus sp. NREL 46B-D3]
MLSGSSSPDSSPAVDSSSSTGQQQRQQRMPKHVQQQRRQPAGSPHSREVLAAAAARQQLLSSVLDAGEVGGWLLAARAQDVCVVDIRGRAGLQQQLVVGSGLSQRHSHACAEAVAWQLKEKARQHLLLQQQQQDADGSSNVEQVVPPLRVLGDASSDWAVLDAGAVVVHVLTERARRFYNLEGLWGGPQGRFITWLKPEQLVETKDTIGRQGAAGSSTGAAVH